MEPGGHQQAPGAWLSWQLPGAALPDWVFLNLTSLVVARMEDGWNLVDLAATPEGEEGHIDGLLLGREWKPVLVYDTSKTSLDLSR